MESFLYCRISESWKSLEKNRWIGKLGSTMSIENRKWEGATERLYPCYYLWFITITDLGQFSNVISAEKTAYKHTFFSSRNIYNGEGSGVEFFEFNDYDDPLGKMCQIMNQYDVEFRVTVGDPFITRPEQFRVDEMIGYDQVTSIPCVSDKIRLRPYQKDIVGKMMDNVRGVLILATGLGKTVIFCSYIKQRDMGRYLIVVPTINLVNQTLETCRKIIGNGFRYCKHVHGQSIPDCDRLVVVGTYQSSDKLCRISNIDCVIFDECHSTVLNPTLNTCRRFQQLLGYECSHKFFFTATEKNLVSDGSVISMDNPEIYGDVLYRYELGQAISDGYLADYKFELNATVNKKLSTKRYVELGYKTAVFCSDQAGVEDVYSYLVQELPDLIRVFKLGEYDDIGENTRLFSDYLGRAAIVSCRKINTGYDEPQIDTIVHYSISTSSIMTIQRNGRGLRLHRDKVLANMIFLCDVSGSEKTRKDEIESLQRPISYIKACDSRFEKRLLKEIMKDKGEFVTMSIRVDEEMYERKEIYDRCWNMLGKRLTYGETKEILRKKASRVVSKLEYNQLCEIDLRLPRDPVETFRDKFIGWVDFLGIDTSKYYTVEECKKVMQTMNIHISGCLKPSKTCLMLCEMDRKFPPVDMWVDIYSLKKLDDIFVKDCACDDVPAWLSKKILSRK